MAGPWDKYSQTTSQGSGPWDKYSQKQPQQESIPENPLLQQLQPQQLSPNDFTKPGEAIPKEGGLVNFARYNAAHFNPNTPENAIGIGAASAPLELAGPVAETLQNVGKTLYASGLKNVDRAVAKYGKSPVSDVLLSEGAWGGPQALHQASEDIIDKLGQHKDNLAQAADQAGGTVDMRSALKNALDQSVEMQQDPATRAIGQAMNEHLGQYLENPQVPVSQASNFKKSINQSLGSEAYNMAKQTKPGQKILKQFQNDLDSAIEEGANNAAPGMELGKKMSAADDAMGPLLQARPQFMNEIQKSTTRNAVSPVDMMLGGAATMAHQSPGRVAAIMAAKKAADISKTSTFRTGAGLGTYNLGNFADKFLVPEPAYDKAFTQALGAYLRNNGQIP